MLYDLYALISKGDRVLNKGVFCYIVYFKLEEDNTNNIGNDPMLDGEGGVETI